MNSFDATFRRNVMNGRRRDEPASRRLWQTAISFSDLLFLNTAFLFGKIRSPMYGEIDEETIPLLGALTSLNRLGLFTEFSQPGERWEGPNYKTGEPYISIQRAAVAGFAFPKTAALLSKRLDERFAVNPARRMCVTKDRPVRRKEWREFTWTNGNPEADRRQWKRFLSPAAYDNLLFAVHFEAVEKEWESNELWGAILGQR